MMFSDFNARINVFGYIMSGGDFDRRDQYYAIRDFVRSINELPELSSSGLDWKKRIPLQKRPGFRNLLNTIDENSAGLNFVICTDKKMFAGSRKTRHIQKRIRANNIRLIFLNDLKSAREQVRKAIEEHLGPLDQHFRETRIGKVAC
jgi:hypothetical protein